MQFTHPNALWLLLLAPLPWLLSRRRPPSDRRFVSNLYLWRAAIERISGSLARRRVRRSWLVAAQTACLAAMVTGLGQPVIARGRETTVLVFDVSASMGARDEDGTRLDAAKRRARSEIAALPSTSRVRVVLAAAAPLDTGTWIASDPRLLASIDRLRATAGRADLAAAVDVAAQQADARRIVVFSDAMPATTETGTASPAVQWLHVGHPDENSAVVRVVAEPATLGARTGRALVVLRHYGIRPREADVEIAVDGTPSSRIHVQLAPGSTHTLTVALREPGEVVTARLADGDALPIDDVRSAVIPRARQMRVVLLGRRGSFLEHALEVNPSVALSVYEGNGASDIPSSLSPEKVDVLVCDACQDDSRRGIPTLVVAGSSGEHARGPAVMASASHPVAASLDLGQQTATVAATASLDTNSDVILRVAGLPAVIASSDPDAVRSVEVRVDIAQPDFALSPAFPILVANALEWLTAPGQIPREATAGDPLAFPGAIADRGPFRVTGPDGRARTSQRVRQQFLVFDTEAVGPYRVGTGGSESLVIVNPAVDGESDLGAFDRVMLPGTHAQEDSVSQELIALGPWMMLAALALLATEWRFRAAGVS